MASILIIDDEDGVRKMMARILEREGHEVTTAKDGNEGIELFQRKQSDILITDIIMPKKEGIETINELKQEFPGIKIIAISGGGKIGPGDYLFMAKVVGAQKTLIKPFGKEELVTAVNELLGE